MISVLIVNWNTRDFLRSCLESIHKFPPSQNYEVIVVDNASSDGSAAMVQSQFPGVKLIAHSANSGYAKGNNLAFEAASGEWLLTLNPDTEFVDDSLQKAVDILAAHPKIGCLGAKLTYPDGRTQSSVRGWPTASGIFGDASGLGSRFPAHRWVRIAFQVSTTPRSSLHPSQWGRSFSSGAPRSKPLETLRNRSTRTSLFSSTKSTFFTGFTRRDGIAYIHRRSESCIMEGRARNRCVRA